MSKRKNYRDIDGILLVDKPQGLTSNKVLQITKHLYHAKKAGHTGSLDPLATGMLPICFGQATKYAQHLLNADKIYRTTATLGVTTDTGDSEGQIIARKNVNFIASDTIEAVLKSFLGPQQQIPPMFSALKHQGQPLYKLARQGVSVPRKARNITIKQLTLINHHPNELELEVHCTKGTYIRTLVTDIGEKLGCGAHVSQLKRLAIEPYEGKKLYSIKELEDTFDSYYKKNAVQCFALLDSLLMPLSSAVVHWPTVKLSDKNIKLIQQGQKIVLSEPIESIWVAIQDISGSFIGIGEIINRYQLAPRRLLRVK